MSDFFDAMLQKFGWAPSVGLFLILFFAALWIGYLANQAIGQWFDDRFPVQRKRKP